MLHKNCDPLRIAVVATLFAGLFTLNSVRTQANGPAVSDTNAKISTFGGAAGSRQSDDGLGGIAGSLTVPLGHSFGLQIDGSYARIGAANLGGSGAHLFWRSPTAGMFGVYAGYTRLDRYGGIDIGRTGFEAQYFLKRLTFDAAAGYKFGDIETRGYARARVMYYPFDNLMLQTGWVHEGRGFANVGLEYQLASSSMTGLSLFSDANIHDNNHYSLLAGFKITLGKDMSLKDRHRRQDPESYLNNDIQSNLQARDRANAKQKSKGTPTKSEKTNSCPANVSLLTSNTCTCPSGTPKVTQFCSVGTFYCSADPFVCSTM